MIYLLDANVLIDANRDFYAIARVPEFWEWLVFKGQSDEIKIPLEVYEELSNGDDDLAQWIKNPINREALTLDEEVDIELVRIVLRDGYATDLSDEEVERLGRDPFLIAYALKNDGSRCVVTSEVSKPKKQRANKHVPDVCNDLNIPWCHTFEFIRKLGFSTNWRNIIPPSYIAQPLFGDIQSGRENLTSPD